MDCQTINLFKEHPIGIRESEKYPYPLIFPVLNEEISYEEFFETYLKANQPCLIKATEIVENWKSFTDWNAGNGECNVKFFEKILPSDAKVPTSSCDRNVYETQTKAEITLKEYLHYWANRSLSKEILYLKDWHFRRQCPNYNSYRTPKYFASDWLNEYWDSCNIGDDYKFVYVGPRGSWTPFHCDVFRSFSWSANVVGQKRWIVFPPGEENKLSRLSSTDLAHSLSELIPRSSFSPSDDFRLKTLEIDKSSNCNFFEIFQNSGEVIFIPSGWHHQVENVQDTISINHNWFNGSNVSNFIWKGLSSAYDEVIQEISDCKDTSTEEEFEEMCQNLLKLNYGMNFNDFTSLLNVISTKRINYLMSKSELDLITFDSWCLGIDHTIFDLQAVQATLEQMNEKSGNFDRKQIQEILSDVRDVLMFSCNSDQEDHNLLP